MKTFNFVVLVVIVVVYINSVIMQRFPTNPCPNLFRYLKKGNGEIVGRVEFPNDYSGEYRLTVSMSVAALLSNDKVGHCTYLMIPIAYKVFYCELLYKLISMHLLIV